MPLSVSILSPVDGAVVAGPSATVVLSASPVSTHPIDNVEFFSGTRSLGQVRPTVTGYSPVATGTVALTVTLAGVTGSLTTFLSDFAANDYVVFGSEPTSVYRVASVTNDTSLTLTTPFTGTTVGSTTIRKVSLFSFYNIAWSAVPPGSYVLSAVVTDIAGSTAASSTVTISVQGVSGSLPASISGSSIGFGRNPFGHHQFGYGDWAEEMLWGNLPQVYKDCDEAGPTGSVVSQPLRKFQDALKPSYQDLRIKWHQFVYLWDAIRVPLDQLPQLGYNVGITVDSTKAEGLQRSSVLNASQLWINKGTDKGYQITAAFEGLLVDITPLWAKTCGPSSLLLGTVGVGEPWFDLSTKDLSPRPVGPGTLHLKVTTSYGIEEDIYDDAGGSLFGAGNPLTGSLTRLNVSSAVSLSLVSIVGIFSEGDTVTQGGSSGTVIAVHGARVVLLPLVGTFGPGAVLDTTSGATATATAVTSDVLSHGETFIGETSGTTAVVREFTPTYSIIDSITTLFGFTVGETLRGTTSGNYAVAGTSAVLLPGPLRPRLDLSAVVGSFTVDDQITGLTSGAVGIVREVGSGLVFVDTVTQPGFTVGETVVVGPNSATIDSITYGTIDYVLGKLTGHTVRLLDNSEVRAVVDLITTGPTQFLPAYDEVAADEIPMDRVESNPYDRWPIVYRPVRISNGIMTGGECRSHSLRLWFYTPDDTEIEDFIAVASRVTLALEQFRPLHVRFDRISFDGARASSQVWRTGQVAAESSAASVWTASVVGNQQSTTQVWTSGPFSATVDA